MVKTKRTMPVDAGYAACMTQSEGQMDATDMTRFIAAAAALLTTILLSGYMVAVG
jgi:hypothetical protein